MIGTLVQNYKVVSKIGEGGMGTVYLAEHTTISRKVAIKFLNPVFLQNAYIKKEFINEAQILANLYHPNIVLFIDFGTFGNNFYFIMEFVEGISLDKIIFNKNYHLSEKLVIKVFTDILMGLDYAHKNGVIHRDLKPSNIIISKDWTSKLLDFGIAKILSADVSDKSTGIRVGTPYYMSPEQILKSNIIDLRTDIYSIGITMFEVLTKSLPYGDLKSDFLLTQKIIEEEIPSPKVFNPSVSDFLESVILKATEKDPAKRFQNCREFLDALNNPNFRYKRKGSSEKQIPKPPQIIKEEIEKTKLIEEEIEKVIEKINDKKEEIQENQKDEKKPVISKIENPYKVEETEKPKQPEKPEEKVKKNRKKELYLYIISAVSIILLMLIGLIILPSSEEEKNEKSDNKVKVQVKKQTDTISTNKTEVEIRNETLNKEETKTDRYDSDKNTSQKKTKYNKPKTDNNTSQRDRVSPVPEKKDVKKDDNKKPRVRFE